MSDLEFGGIDPHSLLNLKFSFTGNCMIYREFYKIYTVYAVHLVDIKFGELVCDINWQIFSLATRVDYVTNHGYV